MKSALIYDKTTDWLVLTNKCKPRNSKDYYMGINLKDVTSINFSSVRKIKVLTTSEFEYKGVS